MFTKKLNTGNTSLDYKGEIESQQDKSFAQHAHVGFEPRSV